ncbi:MULTISPECIES: NADH-quinone oxidoreductase subunit B family protein [unclassified Rhodococcus (in: high G+C Gram-positive bacteria)]|uniref:NADH-quinone oxidoreductase subunit B family protein n=1 Tax=unclassified Rhodococcus (in: high G+C Gram-positive bacteria) TaxID=192944 RepID=UPI00131F6ADB|nr:MULTISPECIES: NADH-quinone oxidoreductase subunit B family protein [unclassified Rhodococcus (in: high G+C Gram-positive bacteria)]QHE74073.1 Formate hydrogenlyase subunit 7 [Rhodococcus sp. WAY2]
MSASAGGASGARGRGLVHQIRRIGRIAEAEPVPPAGPGGTAADGMVEPFLPVTGSIQVRHVDAGSCNGCEVEIASAFGPVYDAERYGIRLVASPRHADVLLVTGPVTHNMADPLRATYEAMPYPKRVVALGDCARDCGVFAGGFGVLGAVREVIPVDLEVPGCPPTPEAIVAALRRVSGR